MLLFVNDLTVMDFSYLCEQRGIVGESWIVDVILDGDLNQESMLLDFGLVKKHIKRLIDTHADHKLLVPVQRSITHVEQRHEDVWVDFQRADNKSIHLKCPRDAFALIPSDLVDMSSVSAYLTEITESEMPSNVVGVQLGFREEAINTPYYHYSHGLKKHDGNCQRIVHGHRSKIQIEKDGQRCSELEASWSQHWRDIYIGTQEDVVPISALDLSEAAGQLEKGLHIGFGYEASQGDFQLLVPASECEIIDVDSTVECLAQYIADQLKQAEPECQFKVFAFEGVGKGAIAFSH